MARCGIPDGGEVEDSDDEGVEVECENCGYVWIYKGEMWKATCPRCGRKTPTPHDPDYEDDEE